MREYLDKVAAIAQAIARADQNFSYSIRLTRLVDEVSTYTAVCSGAAPSEFPDNESAGEWIDKHRELARAEEVLRALEALA